jgi:hypothetical protein
MDNNSNKGKLKITKEQYNRIFASGLIKESVGENNAPYVQYYKDMSGEEPFMLGNNKYQYVWAIYPSGKKDIGVYAFGQDLVYDYQVFRQMHNINEDQAPKVKGGLSRVDKEFKKAMGGKEVQRKWGKKNLTTSEGIVKYNQVEYTLGSWIDNFKDYLKSAMSYTNSLTLEEFKDSEFIFITENALKRFNK